MCQVTNSMSNVGMWIIVGIFYKYIYSIVNDLDLAEDLMQETFLKAYIKANTFRENASVKTWLFRIAYHVSMDFSERGNLIING